MAETSRRAPVQSDPVSDRVTPYFVLLLLLLVGTGFFDTFATQFRYTMTTYVRQDFEVEFGEFAGMMSWVYLASCLSFVPRALADVIGRKPLLCFTLAGICGFQWLLSYARTPGEYVALLSLLALFYKSDIWLLVVAEEAPPARRGLWATATGAVTGVGAITLGELVRRMERNVAGWREVARFPLWGVLLTLPLVLCMRETGPYQRLRQSSRRATSMGFLVAPFRADARRPLLLVSFLKMFFAGGAFVAVAIMGSEYLRTENGFDNAMVGRIVQFDVVASMLALTASGAIADRFGRRPCFTAFGALYSASLVGLAIFPKGSETIVVSYVLQSFAATGMLGVLRLATMEVLPDDCRATGSAWSDLGVTLSAAGTARVLGAVTSGGIGWLGVPSLSTILLAIGLAVPLLIPLYLRLNETRGIRLERVGRGG